tara:strand:- start:92 stop:385 length:294 start_codon:yes stop_codon:yes gene_type:complete
MTQQFSPQQQARINERLRIEKLPKSPRSIYEVVEGDIVTDGYRFFVVVELLSYNGYDNAMMLLFCLHQCPNTGIWGYLEHHTVMRFFTIMPTVEEQQ